jgi:hypothetical protein
VLGADDRSRLHRVEPLLEERLLLARVDRAEDESSPVVREHEPAARVDREIRSVQREAANSRRGRRRPVGVPPRDRGGEESAGREAERRDRREATRASRVLLVTRPCEDPLELEARVARVAQAFARLLREAALDQLAQAGRCRGRKRARVDLLLQHRGQHVADRLAGERAPSGQALVQHATERPQVDAPVDRPAARLLGRHVGRRADEPACFRRQRAVVRGAAAVSARDRLREPEVEQLHFRLEPVERQTDVGRLEVAVDHARVVRRLEPLGDLASDRERLRDRERAAPQPVLERLAGHELEREEVEPIRVIDAVDLRDAGVVERRERPRLALESREPLRILGEALRQDLDRDVTPETRVARAIHLAHRTRAEQLQELVVRECSPPFQRHGAGV